MPCFIKKVLINRRMPTTFRMWLLIDLAEKKLKGTQTIDSGTLDAES